MKVRLGDGIHSAPGERLAWSRLTSPSATAPLRLLLGISISYFDGICFDFDIDEVSELQDLLALTT